jgi:hypothetical protein
MYRWQHSIDNVKLETRTIREFSDLTGMRYSNAKSLACGHYQTLNGWLSPKAPKARKKRFQTVLRNFTTNERVSIGASLTALSKRIGVGMNDLWKVVNGYGGKLAIKGWMLESTYQLAQGDLADNVA